MAVQQSGRPFRVAHAELEDLDQFLTELSDEPDAWQPDARGDAAPSTGLRSIAVETWGERPGALDGLARHSGDVLGGRFLIESVIGRNDTEVALIARDLGRRERVLLRVVNGTVSTSPASHVRAFQNAAKKAHSMRSAGAERVLEFGVLPDGYPYRAAQLPSGPSLAEVLHLRGPLGISESVDLILGLCETLSEAHALQLSYRSLSCSSLHLQCEPGGRAYLVVVDYGAPSERRGAGDRLPRTITKDGLRYLAPEQLEAGSSVDHRADIWSLGAIAYEMLSGRAAFDGASPRATLAQIATRDAVPLRRLRADVPAALALAVHACLQNQAWQRPASSVDVATMLRPFSSEPPPLRSPLPLPASSAPSTLIGFRAPTEAEIAEPSVTSAPALPPLPAPRHAEPVRLAARARPEPPQRRTVPRYDLPGSSGPNYAAASESSSEFVAPGYAGPNRAYARGSVAPGYSGPNYAAIDATAGNASDSAKVSPRAPRVNRPLTAPTALALPEPTRVLPRAPAVESAPSVAPSVVTVAAGEGRAPASIAARAQRSYAWLVFGGALLASVAVSAVAVLVLGERDVGGAARSTAAPGLVPPALAATTPATPAVPSLHSDVPAQPTLAQEELPTNRAPVATLVPRTTPASSRLRPAAPGANGVSVPSQRVHPTPNVPPRDVAATPPAATTSSKPPDLFGTPQ